MCAGGLLAEVIWIKGSGILTQHVALLVLDTALVGHVVCYAKVNVRVVFCRVLTCVKASYDEEAPFAMNGLGLAFDCRAQCRQREVRSGNVFGSELKSYGLVNKMGAIWGLMLVRLTLERG